MRRFFLILFLLLPLAAVGTACENPLAEDSVVTFDTLTLGVPNAAADLPSAIDLPAGNVLRRPERLNDVLAWDFALRQEGSTFFLRPNTAESESRRPRITRSTTGFDQLDEAPRDRAAYQTTPIALEVGATYVARSRITPGLYGELCTSFAKLQVLETNPAAGTVRLRIRTNLGCDDERLVDD